MTKLMGLFSANQQISNGLSRPLASHSIVRRRRKEPTSDHTVDGLLKVLPAHGRVEVSGGDERGLVAHVGDVRS